MDEFQKKTFETSRGLIYTYWMKPSNTRKPALLLQHGFPDDHDLWTPILPYIKDLGYPIIIPDLLGYGETSKPSDAKAYRLKDMAKDLMEILDKEDQKFCISVGHDWGSMLAQRVTLFNRDRVVGMIILNVSYNRPAPMDAKAANQMLTKLTGLPRLSYQEFFVSPQGRDLLEGNLESVFHVLHGAD